MLRGMHDRDTKNNMAAPEYSEEHCSFASCRCVRKTNSDVHKTILPPNYLGGGNPFSPLKVIKTWKRDVD